MNKLTDYLKGGDLRSIAKVDQVVTLVKTQSDFDQLFQYLHSRDRLVTMRAADAVEKITVAQPKFLANHKQEVLNFIRVASDKEFKWHLALIITRLDLNKTELREAWNTVARWAKDRDESRIVRVNSIQSLFDLAKIHPELHKELNEIIHQIKEDNIPSINARLKKLQNQ